VKWRWWRVEVEMLDDCGGGGGISGKDIVTQDYIRVRNTILQGGLQTIK